MGNQTAIFDDAVYKQLNTHKIKQQVSFSYVINHPVLKNTQFTYEEEFSSKNDNGLAPNKMKTKLSMQTYAQIDQWSNKISQFKKIKNQHLLFPLQVNTTDESTFGYYKELQLVFECYPYILMDQINMRKNINNNFQEDQIWYILWVLAESSCSLLRNNLCIGDIRPHNILFNETGQIKIISQFSWPKQYTNFHKILKNKVKTYLSPQQMQIINRGVDIDLSNPELSQSFSIGLTILSLLYLQDGSKLYKLREAAAQGQNLSVEFDAPALEMVLRNMSTLRYYNTKTNRQMGYSYSLLKIVQGLCLTNINKRHKIKNIWQTLTPFRSKILNFQLFQLPHTSIYYNNLLLSPLHLTQRLISIPQQSLVPQKIRLHPNLLINHKNVNYTPIGQFQQSIPQIRPAIQLNKQAIQFKPYLIPNKLIQADARQPMLHGNLHYNVVKHVPFISNQNHPQYSEHQIKITNNSNQHLVNYPPPRNSTDYKSISTDKYTKQQDFINNVNKNNKNVDNKKKIYRSSTVKKTGNDSPIHSLNSSRYQNQWPQQPRKNINTFDSMSQTNNQEVENKKNAYSVITLQKVISSKNENKTKLNNQSLTTHTHPNAENKNREKAGQRLQNKKQTKLRQDEELLALVQRQLMKSKSLFPSSK